MSFEPEQPPGDVGSLPAWVHTQLRAVGTELEAVRRRLQEQDHELLRLAQRTTAPTGKLRHGQFAFADGTNWDPGWGRGLYGYNQADAVWSPLMYQRMFSIVGEENSNIAASGVPFSFGDGGAGRAVCLPFECELMAMSLTRGANGDIDLRAYVNGVVDTSYTLTCDSAAEYGVLPTPIVLAAGDTFTFNVSAVRTTATGPVVAAAWFRLLD